MTRPSRRETSKEASYHQFLALSSQQETIRRRLSLQTTSSTPMATMSPESLSLSSSPYNSRTSFSFPYSTSPESTVQLSTFPYPIIPGYHNSGDGSTGELHKLYEINQQIKATLTELLNIESVKSDEKFRSYLQGRLMDAEIEMRKQRRRRSSSIDREMAQSIAGHFEHGSFRFSP